MSVAHEKMSTRNLSGNGRCFSSFAASLLAAGCSSTASTTTDIRGDIARFLVDDCPDDSAVLVPVTSGATGCCIGLASCLARSAAYF